MDELQLLERQEPQPQERRHRLRIAGVFGLASEGLEEGLLDYIRGVDPAAEPVVQPHRDHAAQPVAIGLQEPAPVDAVPPGPRSLVWIAVRILPRPASNLIRAHTVIDCAPPPIRDRVTIKSVAPS